jgi:hypothetical protein
MDTQQMLELLLKKIRTNQENMEADWKADKEEIEADHKELLARLEENIQADQRFLKEMMQMMDISHKEIMAEIKPGRDLKMMSCQEMEECAEEEQPTSLDMKPEAAQQEEVPEEDAKVMPVGEPRTKRRRDRKMAAQHRRQKPKEFTPENCGPQKRMAVTRSGSSRRGKVTWHTKEVDQKMPRRAKVARRIRDIFRPNTTRRAKVAREIAKKINTSVLLQRSKRWTLWRGRPPPKRKKGNSAW